MKWLDPLGGPLILIDRAFVKEWRGIDKSSDEKYDSDYDRACDATNYAELIQIPNGMALVLGDEPSRTSVIERPPDKAIIIRWKWAPNEMEVESHLSNAWDLNLPILEKLQFIQTSNEAIIFDASFSDPAIDDFLTIHLVQGRYTIETALYQPNKKNCVLLHKIRREI